MQNVEAGGLLVGRITRRNMVLEGVCGAKKRQGLNMKWRTVDREVSDVIMSSWSPLKAIEIFWPSFLQQVKAVDNGKKGLLLGTQWTHISGLKLVLELCLSL